MPIYLLSIGEVKVFLLLITKKLRTHILISNSNEEIR